jgi:hypothetical protein
MLVDYSELVDIRYVKKKEKSSRIENALFLLEQINDHKMFRVDGDIVEIRFNDTGKTLSDVLTSHLQQMNRAEHKNKCNVIS